MVAVGLDAELYSDEAPREPGGVLDGQPRHIDVDDTVPECQTRQCRQGAAATRPRGFLLRYPERRLPLVRRLLHIRVLKLHPREVNEGGGGHWHTCQRQRGGQNHGRYIHRRSPRAPTIKPCWVRQQPERSMALAGDNVA